ncbi:RdgB/HAM1 family non-canonical purine NTP pyrophosphatase [bacterium]|nr:RdgB/HAM1 family non-canonical purine NTP pyrophosphatase [bacterium]
MKILVATSNSDKLVEYKKALSIPEIELMLPEESIDVIEDCNTLMENSRLKGIAYFNRFKLPVLADDTGLFVHALNGAPGVHSARYSTKGTYDANVIKLLKELEGITERRAFFETVIFFKSDEKSEYFFSGKCHGTILSERTCSEGFGYDPVFLPDGYELSFSQITLEEKNRISHRGLAVAKFKKFISHHKDIIK